MKYKSTWLFATLACFCALFLFPAFAHAQEAAPIVPISLTPEYQNFVLNMLTSLIAKYPVLATLVGILGSMRLWAKPLSAFVHGIVELTPSKTDDGMWASVYDFLTLTATGKTLAWLLDYVTSIKIVPPAPKPSVTIQEQAPTTAS